MATIFNPIKILQTPVKNLMVPKLNVFAVKFLLVVTSRGLCFDFTNLLAFHLAKTTENIHIFSLSYINFISLLQVSKTTSVTDKS